MSDSKRMDVRIETAGAMIWMAPHGLGGHTPNDLGQAWMGKPTDVGLDDFLREHLFFPLVLQQGSSFVMRWVEGKLNPQEDAEWVARARANLSIACGKVMACGVLTPDFETLEYPTITEAKPRAGFPFGCFLSVKPGDYEINVYSYAPNDLTGAWGSIEDPNLYGHRDELEPEEPKKYFQRTRTGASLPDWIAKPMEDASYVQFVVQLLPRTQDLGPLKLDDSGGAVWEFRKPKLCPLGIKAEF